MTEVELKLQVPPGRRARVEREVAGRAALPRVRLQAAYVDTAGGALAAAGIGLRMRREGRLWVQTLKGAAADGMTRAEHNVPRAGSAASVPDIDPRLHADTDIGRRLLDVLKAADAPLVVQFRTDIRRRKRVLRTALGSVELAFDDGHVIAGDRRWPVCELEIELVAGRPAAVIETARRWIARHGLWLDTRTKAERGGLLARGLAVAPPTRPDPVTLNAGLSAAAAEATLLNACLRHVASHAAQVASGGFGDEHVHQLRVGLRRLRSAMALFGDDADDPAIGADASAVCRAFGASRDAAMLQPIEAALRQAQEVNGLDLPRPETGTSTAADPARLARGADMQTLLLDLMRRATKLQQETAAEGAPPLRDLLARRLSRWHRGVVTDAARFGALDDEARHRMRKHVKRLRYAVEFAGGVFEGKRQRAYVKRLRRLQDRLGELNDATTALGLWRDHAVDRPGNAFAIGWLVARREALVLACEPALAAFADAKTFWKC